MDLVLCGKVVNTHGIKGELKLLSDFEYKNRIFKEGKKIYIDSQEYTITSYRFHKIFDMITLEGFTDINEVLFLKGKKVYCKKEDLDLKDKEYLIQDLIGIEVYFKDNLMGNNVNFIDSINLKEKKIILKNCEGLL